MKHKKIYDQRDKKNFVYRIQSTENPLWLNYFNEFDAYYLAVPNEIVECINKEISEIINPNYKIEISKEHSSTSIGVKVYEFKDKIGQGKVRLSDVALKFNEYTFGKKVGLSKTLMEAKISDKKQSYLAADDFFEDVETENITQISEQADGIVLPF